MNRSADSRCFSPCCWPSFRSRPDDAQDDAEGRGDQGREAHRQGEGKRAPPPTTRPPADTERRQPAHGLRRTGCSSAPSDAPKALQVAPSLAAPTGCHPPPAARASKAGRPSLWPRPNPRPPVRWRCSRAPGAAAGAAVRLETELRNTCGAAAMLPFVDLGGASRPRGPCH